MGHEAVTRPPFDYEIYLAQDALVGIITDLNSDRPTTITRANRLVPRISVLTPPLREAIGLFKGPGDSWNDALTSAKITALRADKEARASFRQGFRHFAVSDLLDRLIEDPSSSMPPLLKLYQLGLVEIRFVNVDTPGNERLVAHLPLLYKGEFVYGCWVEGDRQILFRHSPQWHPSGRGACDSLTAFPRAQAPLQRMFYAS